jgi:hypothetical protein
MTFGEDAVKQQDQAAEKLREARALIEQGWTQGEYARGKSGRKAHPVGRYARCFCAVGALGAANRHWPHAGMVGLKYLNVAIGRMSVGESLVFDWNDVEWRTQAQVLAAFDRAIELAEQSA